MFIRHGDDPRQRSRFSRRALLLGAAQTAAFGALGTRLFQLQVMEEMRYAPLAEVNRINIQPLAPARGRIVDRFGEPLASNIEGYRVMLMPSLAHDASAVLVRLARLVPLSADEQEKIVVRAKRQPPNLPIVVLNDLTWEQVAEINLLAPQLPGLQTEIAGRRQYFRGHTVGHIVGYVGAVERAAMDDDPVLRLPGLRVGKSGIELGMEDVLRGQSGTVKYEVDSRGRIIRNLEQNEPQRGADVVLTIDTGLQEKVIERLRKERRGAVVAIDVNTGEVVAMASVPTFDPSEIASGITSDSWQRMQSAANDPMLNRAVRGLYPPGSTFKIVTALAALEAGVVTLKERIECHGSYELAGQNFRCWKRSGHGACDMHRALRESCDCYFYEIARRSGIDAIATMARRFGFAQTFQNGLSLQKSGLIPDPDWKLGRFGRSWLGGETLLAGIGQGYVLSTPLQLAVMTARIASGRAVVPSLVRPSVGTPAPVFDPLGTRPASLEAVRRGMIAVVNEDGGTGSNAQLDDGPQVAGKTGTSQVNRASTDRRQSELEWDERDHALFVGYAPASKPRYAVVAVIEHGGGGGATAAPVVRDVMKEVLARDPSARPAYPDAAAGQAGSVPARGAG